MATRESIEFNFQKALREASEIDEIAEKLSSLSRSKFESTMQTLATVWKGDSAPSYFRKGDTLQEKMNRTSAELHNIASNLRAAARRLYEAEMAALTIAQSREY